MEILDVFRLLRKNLGLAIVLITHNPALLSGIADRVLVLYGGQVMELGLAREVLFFPKHPYTQALFQSIPSLDGPHDAGRRILPAIPRDSNSSSLARAGCPFEPRCAERMEITREW
jgi:peptide/nickel transport system ATP-binding protein/oligopeptide transport system ATP-binding protein